MPFANPIIGGGGSLVYPSIHSPNYSPGVAGWSINKNGNAEFNNVVIRGTFTGNNYLISAAGIFQYSTTPGANNLQAAFIPGNNAVLDAFGNQALPGINVYTHDTINNEYWLLNILGTAQPQFGWFYNPSNQASWPNAGGGFSPNAITPLDQINVFTSILSLSAATFATDPSIDSVSGKLFLTARTLLHIQNSLIVDNNVTVAKQLISTGGTSTNPSTVSSDSWNTLVLNSATGTVQYAYEPNGVNGKGCIRLRGEAILSANTAADFLIATIPYTFANQQDFVTPTNLSGYAAGQRVVRIATSGNLRIEPSGTSGNFVIFDGVVGALG